VPVNFWLPSLRESPGPAVDLHAAVLRLPLPARITTDHRSPAAGPPGGPARRSKPPNWSAHPRASPAYEITTDLTAGRLRYVARARRLSTHPYLVITTILDELTAELSSAQA
jgi:hypothetical protein